MAEELLPADVASYTNNRLSASDPETQRALDEARAHCRSFCGWHVSPVQSSTVTMRGRGDCWMILRTLKIVSITSATEIDCDGNSTVIDPSELYVLTNEPYAIYRRKPFYCDYTYQIAFTHGFTAAEAADFRGAILREVDRATLNIGSEGSGPVTKFQVDDVTTEWEANDRLPGSVASNPLNDSALYQYRLLPVS